MVALPLAPAPSNRDLFQDLQSVKKLLAALVVGLAASAAKIAAD
jgi:hypothetical protein